MSLKVSLILAGFVGNKIIFRKKKTNTRQRCDCTYVAIDQHSSVFFRLQALEQQGATKHTVKYSHSPGRQKVNAAKLFIDS